MNIIDLHSATDYRYQKLKDLSIRAIKILRDKPKELLCKTIDDKNAEPSNEMKTNIELENITYKKYIMDLLYRTDSRSSEYVPISQNCVHLESRDIKIIAFYLPQYHPIPENDEWWGKGFTDWINVSKAVPQFLGHYQPHLPDELGFYDLRLIEIQKRQIELARQYGIYGFCFHYYWFGGQKLLENPIYRFLKNRELDYPFCICWANENWTRRWDGLDNEVLVAQTHSPETDIAFIKDILPFLRDRRYIKIDNKPILIVYRAPLLPDASATIERWRSYCREQGIDEIYLIAAQTFGFEDPRSYGFDAAVEFPPLNVPEFKYDENKIAMINPKFAGKAFDFDAYIKSKLYLRDSPYCVYKTAMPGWDNTARRPNNGSIFHGANPANYKEWLNNIIAWTRKNHEPEKQFIFINAWNEWAEGAHLEPDRKYGYGYLQSTAEVIESSRNISL